MWLYPGHAGAGRNACPRAARWRCPLDRRSGLVATFNSGFKLADSGGGFASGGHTYAPLKAGLATIVRYRDGHVDVIVLERRSRRRLRT